MAVALLAMAGHAWAVETLDFGTNTSGNLFTTPINANIGGITATVTASQSGGPWDSAPDVRTSAGGLNGIGGVVLMNMDAALNSSLPWTQVTFSFSRPVTNLTFTVVDIDGGPGHSWNDRVVFNSLPATTPTVVTLGSQVSWTAATRTAQATSNGNLSGNTGNIRLSFPQPVTQVTVRYIAGPAVDGSGDGPNNQSITIDDLSWDSGVVRVNKSTTPGIGGPFSFTQTNLLTTPASITTTAAGTPTPASPVAHEIGGPGNTVTVTESPAAGWVLASATCSDANSAVTGNTGTFGTVSGNTVSLNAASLVLSGADITCRFNNTVPPPPSFGTCDARMFMDQIPTNISTLFNVNYATAPFTLTALGSSTATTGRNGVGYNQLDNYMYGIRWPTSGGVVELIRIGADGSGQNLGVISGLPNGTYNNGVISPAGIYYLKTGFSDTTLYRVDLTTTPYTATTITLSQPVQAFDLAWHNNRLYGVDITSSPSQLVSIDPASGAVTTLGPSSPPLSNALAMWGFNNMLLGSSGTAIYALDPVTGSATLLSNISPTANNGDGANCPGANIQFNADLSVTKTNTPASGPNDLPSDTYVPGETRTYTIVVRNTSASFGAQNITVSDPVPAGIDAATVSWTCSNTSGGSRCGAASGTGALNDTGLDLPPNAVATYLVTMTVPADFTGNLTNTVTITPPSTINDTDPTNNTATDTDGAAPSLTLTKISLGGVRAFTFTGNNGWTSQTLTTVAPGTGVTGDTQALANPGVATTITETMPPGFVLDSVTCTGMGAGGTVTTGSNSFTLNAAAVAAGSNIACTVTNSVQTQPAFPSCPANMYLSQGPNANTNTSLYNISTGTNPFTYPLIGQGANVYNAIGFNPVDNYLYGINHGGGTGNRLIRIGADGSTVDLGPVAGMSVANWISGTFSDTGVLYVLAGGGSTNLRAIDVQNNTSTLIPLSASVQASDMAWIDGLLYTVQAGGQLRSINPATGAVTNIGPPSGAADYGAMFGSPTGLFGSANTGGFYSFDLATGARTLVSGSPGATVNDGANCPTAPITFAADLSITKTNTPGSGAADLPDDSYVPGETRTYHVVVTNNGPFGVQNATVSDPVPAGISPATVSWTCASTSGGAVCGAAGGAGALNDTGLDLPAGAVATYLVTMTVPVDFTGALSNTATVTPPANTNDATPGNNTATDVDTASTADLSITKTNTPGVNGDIDQAGDTLLTGQQTTYDIVVRNLGGDTVSNAILRDPAPAGLSACVLAAPECTPSGAATCPALGAGAGQLSIANLQDAAPTGGVLIPSMAAGSSITVRVTCTVD